MHLPHSRKPRRRRLGCLGRRHTHGILDRRRRRRTRRGTHPALAARREDTMAASSDTLRPAGPCTIVIFGAAGDLTKRKLLPALYNLKIAGLLPHGLALVGVARRPKSVEQFRQEH